MNGAAVATQNSPIPSATSGVLWIVMVTLVGLVPILLVDYMPSHDGPSHVYLAQVLRLYDDVPAFRDYFIKNWNFQPNLFVYALLQPLLDFLNPAAAEKAIAAIYVLLIPGATCVLARSIRLSAAVLHLALWPLLYGFMFFFGFYNFCFSLLFSLAALAVFFQLDRTPNYFLMALLCALSVTAYFTHLFPVANLLLFTGVYILAKTFIETTGEPLRARLLSLWAESWRPGAALLPAFLLILFFLGQSASGAPPSETPYGFLERLTHLAMLSFNLAYAPTDMVISISMLLLFAAIYFLRSKPAAAQPLQSRIFAVLTFVYIAVLFAIPLQLAGSTFVLDRFLPFLYLAFVLWLVSQPLNPRQYKALLGGLIVIVLSLTLYRAAQFVRLDLFMGPMRAVQNQLEPGATLLALRGASYEFPPLFWRPQYRINVPLHASAMLAAEKHLVDMKLVQANTEKTPLKYRDAVNPYWQLPAGQPSYPAKAGFRTTENLRLEQSLPALDFDGYRLRTGGQVDYLLLWGAVLDYENSDEGKQFLKQIAQSFDQVPLSTGSYHLRLFKSKRVD